MDLVSHLVINLQHYQPQDAIYGDYMMTGYDEQLLKTLLGYFSVENLRTTVIAKGLEYDKTAKWYFTPYSVKAFDEQQLSKFTAPSDLSFSLPSKNPFFRINSLNSLSQPVTTLHVAKPHSYYPLDYTISLSLSP